MSSGHGVTIHARCFDCKVRERTEWSVLSCEELEQIEAAKNARAHLPGEVLFHEGDANRGVYCLQSGLVGVRKTDIDGNSILLRLAYPGETLGYRSFLAGEDHADSAEVLKASVVCFIDRAPIRRILEVKPALGLRFLRRAARDLGSADERILQSVTLSVRARFAHLLLVLKDRYGMASEGGEIRLELPLSRQDLAAMIGTRPETMSRTIRQMEADGIARFSGRSVVVPTLDGLLDELEPDMHS